MTQTKSTLAIATLIAGGMFATAAHAQDLRVLGYNSALTAACNVGCTQLTLSLALDAARPMDGAGRPVPVAIAGLERYLRNATFQIFGTNPTITGVSGVTGSFASAIDNSPKTFASVVLTDPVMRLSTNRVDLTVDLAPGAGVVSVSANGLGYVNHELKLVDANAHVVRGPSALSVAGGPYYQTGDFNVSTTVSAPVGISAVPEPSSYALMASGLAGLAAVGFRRRRSA